MENKHLAAAVVIGLGILLLSAVFNFLSAFVGALILIVVFMPLFKRLIKTMNEPTAAVLVIIISIVVIIIPLLMFGTAAISQVAKLSSGNLTVSFNETLIQVDEDLPFLNLNERFSTIVANTGQFLRQLINPIVQGATTLVLNLFIMYVLVYFILVDRKKWKQLLHDILPFSTRNENKLLEEFGKVTDATILGSGVMALIQGSLVGISFFVAGIEGAIVWGFAAAILSFLPVIGTPVVWIPAAIYLFLSSSITTTIIFVLFHVIITSNIDNVLRPILNKHFGDIHPLTSLLGVFFGLYLFGMIGVILGPLLISYFFLTYNMYCQEFMKKK